MKTSLYFKIGLFVIVAICLTVGGVIIFGSGQLSKEKVLFETYFDQSVQGLTVGSPVKYRGVEIGSVEDITLVTREYNLNPNDADFHNYLQYVMVKIALEPNTFGGHPFEDIRELLDELIKENGLRIRLSYIGVTGLAYLEVDFVNIEQYEPLPINWMPQSFYIPSAPSTIARIEESVNDLISALETDFFPILENVKAASQDIPSLTDRLNTALLNLNILLEGQQYNMEEIFDNIRLISRDMRELLSLIKEYPSHLMFSDQPPKPKVD